MSDSSTTAGVGHSARTTDFDVVVIGGGPGGSSTATALARASLRVLVLEREKFPRFHIGESQLPWSNEIFRTLGVFEKIRQAGFVEKWGASFRALDGEQEQYADFAVAVETPTPQTFQVPRAQFDHLLLEHSRASGADVRMEHRVLDVAFAPDHVAVRFSGPDGVEQTLRAAAVVDASGRAGFLAKRFGRHDPDKVLKNIAVHAQYEGIPRQEGRRSGDIRMLTREDAGWMWLIPITRDVISVGAVVPQAVYQRESRATPEDSLDHLIATTPGSASLFAGARRVTEARFDADYSYLGSRVAGDRWVAVGDASAFLDPIFSSGVLLAMQGGLDAADAIAAGLRGGDLTTRAFRGYEKLVQRRFHHFRRFAVGFYDPAFRDLWFARSSRFGIYEAILSVLAGNWKPSLGTRARIALFFLLVELQRYIPIAPRSARSGRPSLLEADDHAAG